MKAAASPEEMTEVVRQYVLDTTAEKINAKFDKQADKVAAKAARHIESLDRLAAHLETIDVWKRSDRGSRKPRFTRDDIAAAAIRIADAEGFDAVSMRRLAAELDAGTMSHLVGLNRPAILAVLLATSSGAVGLPVLQGLDRSDRPILVATAWIAIADVVTVLALPLVLANGRLGRVLLGSALVVLTGAVMLLVARATRGRTWARRLRTMSHDRGWGLDLRLSLLALFICAWLASRFGTSILIAGFTVGAAVALLGEPRRVAQQLVGLGEGFAIPLFFVHLGTRIDLGALFQSPRAMALAVTLGLVAILIHVAVGAASRVPVSMSLVASAQLGVPASVVSIGLATQQLTAAQGAAVMASLLITLAACALGSALLGHRGPLTDASAPH